MGERALSAAAAVFLDRDGTLIRTVVENGVPQAARSLAETEILPGVPDALARLRQAGFKLAIFTNQPDVARGDVSRADVEAINAHLRDALGLDAVMCCFHDDADACACRKPQPGMLFDAAAQLGVPLPRSYVVGDRWRDIQAGLAAGCTTILLRQPYSGDSVQPHFEARDLASAAEIILENWRRQ